MIREYKEQSRCFLEYEMEYNQHLIFALEGYLKMKMSWMTADHEDRLIRLKFQLEIENRMLEDELLHRFRTERKLKVDRDRYVVYR